MQLIESHIELEVLTVQENTTYNLNGAGLQIKEIAEKMGIAYETAKSYMKSIKVKLGLQKDKEVTAHFWCSMMGVNMKDETRRIIASVFLLIFICFIPFDTLQMRENRITETRAGRTIVARRNDYTS